MPRPVLEEWSSLSQPLTTGVINNMDGSVKYNFPSKWYVACVNQHVQYQGLEMRQLNRILPLFTFIIYTSVFHTETSQNYFFEKD